MDFVQQLQNRERDMSAVSAHIALLRRSIDPEERLRAARALIKLGVVTRGDSRPRGTQVRVSQVRLPQGGLDEQVLLDALRRSDGKLRHMLVLACSEWGGAQSCDAIAQLLFNTDDKTRGFCMDALSALGGHVAAKALERATSEPGFTDENHESAFDALDELCTGGSADSTEPDPVLDAHEFSSKAQILGKMGSVQSIQRIVHRLGTGKKTCAEEFRAMFDLQIQSQSDLPWEQGLQELMDEHNWPRWAIQVMTRVQESLKSVAAILSPSVIKDAPIRSAEAGAGPSKTQRQFSYAGIWHGVEMDTVSLDREQRERVASLQSPADLLQDVDASQQK